MTDGGGPWRALRGWDEVVVGFVALPDETGGALYWPRGKRAAILLDPRLDQVERRCALAHEMSHHRRGGGCDSAGMPASWDAVVRRDEAAADRAALVWLVDLAELRAALAQAAERDVAVTVDDVARTFDLTPRLAELAMRLIGPAA